MRGFGGLPRSGGWGLIAGMELSEAEAVEDLFRFALLMTGDRQRAVEAVSLELGARGIRRGPGEWARECWVGVARRIWERVRGGEPSGAELPEALRPFLEGLSVEGRGLVALRASGHWELEEIAEVFGLKLGVLRERLHALRESRQGAGLDEVALRDGVLELRASAQERAHFLRDWQRLGESAEGDRGREGSGVGGGRRERVLGVAAVVFGVLFTIVFVCWDRRNQGDAAQVREQVERLLEWNEGSSRDEFERFLGGQEPLEDWLFLRGMESVKLPTGWEGLKVVAARVSPWRGVGLAQLVADEPKAVLLIVKAAALLEAGREYPSGLVSHRGWSGRWELSGAYLVVLAVPGDASALEAALAKLAR
jgi:hypothetical protein